MENKLFFYTMENKLFWAKTITEVTLREIIMHVSGMRGALSPLSSLLHPVSDYFERIVSTG